MRCAEDSKVLAELHRLLSVSVALFACHMVKQTEVDFDHGVCYVAWVGMGKKCMNK